jgi:hypothetical protein
MINFPNTCLADSSNKCINADLEHQVNTPEKKDSGQSRNGTKDKVDIMVETKLRRSFRLKELNKGFKPKRCGGRSYIKCDLTPYSLQLSHEKFRSLFWKDGDVIR